MIDITNKISFEYMNEECMFFFNMAINNIDNIRIQNILIQKLMYIENLSTSNLSCTCKSRTMTNR